MSTKPKRDYKRSFVNFFGGLGYFFVVIEWVWAVVLYSSVLESIVKMISPSVTENTPPPQVTVVVSGGQDYSMMIFGAIIAVAMLVLTAYVLIKMPSAVIKTGKKVVHETAEYATPFVLHIKHRKDTKKNHAHLKFRLTLILKIMLVVLPIVLTLLSIFLETQKVEYDIAVYADIWLASIATASFVSQYLLAKFLEVKRQELW